MSSDETGILKIWKLKYEMEDLEELKLIKETNGIYNISLVNY